MKLQKPRVTEGYQRTRIDGSNMLSGCSSSCAGGDLVIRSVSTSQNGAQSRDLPARRGWDSNRSGTALPRPTGWGLKRCCCVIAALHALRLLSCQNQGVYSQLGHLCWTAEMCPKKGLWCLHTSPRPKGAAVSYRYMKAMLSFQPPLWDHGSQSHFHSGRYLFTPPEAGEREIIPYREVKIAPAVTSRTRLRKTQGKQG